MAYKTRLGGNSATFDSMMKNGFGVVTVMNAKVYDAPEVSVLKGLTAYGVYNQYKVVDPICEIDTFKVANVTQEGPTKTVTGGQYSNPLIKFGKSARLEMQDALGRAKAIDALCGGIMESEGGVITGLHFGEDFVGPKMIIGDSFFIDRKSGQQVKVKIIFYQFLPDSIFNLTQDAEGDATVFDMNGDLLTTEILVGDSAESATGVLHGVFYSIIDENEVAAQGMYYTVSGGTATTPALTLAAAAGYKVNGAATVEIAKDAAVRVKVTTDSTTPVLVFDEVIKNY
jgi:hypothetical protein